jgi:tRNA-specific 2-thiouridylase
MSGGVDSSVAAALLQQQGYAVVGMMMRLWSEPGRAADNRCCTPEAMGIARRVAGQLGIPYYAIDAQEAFRSTVVEYFMKGYSSGETPNPCLACNRHIRWEFLLQQALALGAEYMATGHYVRVTREPGQPVRLFTAIDAAKDQSYVLSVLHQEQLRHALFPLGDYTKPEIRQIAVDLQLPAAQSKESQDLCFLGGEDYRQFLGRNLPNTAQPGPILDRRGRNLGQHIGLINYTIGQRKGLGIASPEPLYVLDKDTAQNTLIVGPADELGQRELRAHEVNWLSGQSPAAPFPALIKIRYKAPLVAAVVKPLKDGGIHAEFGEALRDITPGQAAVVYSENGEVLGGGLIRPQKQSIMQTQPTPVLAAG